MGSTLAIKADPRTPATPVIALTAHALESDQPAERRSRLRRLRHQACGLRAAARKIEQSLARAARSHPARKKRLRRKKDRTAMKSEFPALPGRSRAVCANIGSSRAADLLKRIDGFYKWQDARRQRRLLALRPLDRGRADESFCASPTTSAEIGGRQFRLAGLSWPVRPPRHPRRPRMRRSSAMACTAPDRRRSWAIPRHSIALEKKISEFLEMERVVLYPDGIRRRRRRHQGAGALVRSCRDGRARPRLPAGRRGLGDQERLSVPSSRRRSRRGAGSTRHSRQGHGERHSGRDRRPVLDGLGHARHHGDAGALPRIQRDADGRCRA